MKEGKRERAGGGERGEGEVNEFRGCLVLKRLSVFFSIDNH